MTRLPLLAPFDARVLTLAEVPDAVFARGLAGDGLALDPLGETLHAPCDGEVVQLAPTGHALTLRHPMGAELLLHLGIDTVAMRGAGFEPLVALGARVAVGQPLLHFDLDLIARQARSALTPMLLVGGGRIAGRAAPGRVRRGDWLLDAEAPATGGAARAAAGEARRAAFRVPFEHGLHARPAAQLVGSLRELDCEVELQAHGRRANARSTVALMALGLRAGERVEANARGPDAERALERLAQTLGADTSGATPVSARDAGTSPMPARLAGRVAVGGLALGQAWRMAPDESEACPEESPSTDAAAALRSALGVVTQRLQQRESAARGATRELLAAHRALLEDPELQAEAQLRLRAGTGAARAWHEAIEGMQARLADSGDARIAERRADLRDLRRQVLQALRGETPQEPGHVPPDAVLLADDLLPSQFIALEHAPLAGLCLARGGATSHVALLAAARGLPALVGLGEGLHGIPDGTPLLLDAERGQLLAAPSAERMEAVRRRLARRARREADELAAAAQPARTRDGTAIAVHANLGDPAEVAGALARGADGCGLLRSEFLFLDRRLAPGEDEQADTYAGIARAFGARPLVLRTLDVGGDKPLAYLPLPREENPALGLRGVRLAQHAPELLRVQLRAALRAAASGTLRLMLPMVNDAAELRLVRRWLEEEAARLQLATLPPLGAMVETPAAALQADALLRDADFLSIGSNDLAQYTLAIDRGHAELGSALDAAHPAVLRLIAAVAAAGTRAGKRVSLCGGLASDAAAVPLLIGLGLRELSAVPGAVPRIKRAVREAELDACRRLAERALECDDAAAVRQLLPTPTDEAEIDTGAPARAGEGACAG